MEPQLPGGEKKAIQQEVQESKEGERIEDGGVKEARNGSELEAGPNPIS